MSAWTKSKTDSIVKTLYQSKDNNNINSKIVVNTCRQVNFCRSNTQSVKESVTNKKTQSNKMDTNFEQLKDSRWADEQYIPLWRWDHETDKAVWSKDYIKDAYNFIQTCYNEDLLYDNYRLNGKMSRQEYYKLCINDPDQFSKRFPMSELVTLNAATRQYTPTQSTKLITVDEYNTISICMHNEFQTKQIN
jgi:hypothetical protein